MDISISDLAWAAGFIDGEGCISIKRDGGIVISVANTDPRAIEKIAKLFPGTTRCKYWNSNHRRMFEWAARGNRAIACLHLIRDFLVIKQDQADIALIYCGLPWRGKGLRNRWNPRSPEELAVDSELYTEIKNLKWRRWPDESIDAASSIR